MRFALNYGDGTFIVTARGQEQQHLAKNASGFYGITLTLYDFAGSVMAVMAQS